jgi:hypothetical protein
MSKQTAVKLLIQEIEKDQTIKAKSKSEWNEIFEQAKQMEKEQIIDAIVQVMMKQLNICSESGIIQLVNNAEQYYNETYQTK